MYRIAKTSITNSLKCNIWCRNRFPRFNLWQQNNSCPVYLVQLMPRLTLKAPECLPIKHVSPGQHSWTNTLCLANFNFKWLVCLVFYLYTRPNGKLNRVVESIIPTVHFPWWEESFFGAVVPLGEALSLVSLEDLHYLFFSSLIDCILIHLFICLLQLFIYLATHRGKQVTVAVKG